MSSVYEKYSVNVYSSEGRIYQVEYAMKATSLGTTTIGLKTKDHVILCSEKKVISKLQNPDSIKKHYKISNKIAIGFSGISGDAKPIISKAINFSLDHKHYFNDEIEVERLVHSLSRISLNFDEEKSYKKIFSRPFGVALLFAGYDKEPKLYSLDPSGTYEEHFAKAIGNGWEAVEQILENEYNEDEELEPACKKALSILGRVMKDKIVPEGTEMAIVSKEGVKFLSREEIGKLLQ